MAISLPRILIGCIAVAGAATGAAQPPESTRDLDFFVGQWTGESRFTPAFTPGAETRHEQVRAQCAPVLTGAYVQCDIQLRRSDGRERGVMFLLNFNEVSGQHEILVLASNYGAETSYPLERSADGAWIGQVPTRTRDGREATERIVYRLSPDGRTLRSTESIRPDSTPDAEWVQTYESTWRRID